MKNPICIFKNEEEKKWVFFELYKLGYRRDGIPDAVEGWKSVLYDEEHTESLRKNRCAIFPCEEGGGNHIYFSNRKYLDDNMNHYDLTKVNNGAHLIQYMKNLQKSKKKLDPWDNI